MPNPVYITRNGSDISSSIDWTSVDLLSVLTKEVSTLRFSVKVGAGQTFPVKSVPVLNDTIAMYDNTGQIFGGSVTESEATVQGLMLTYQITCVDWSYLFDGTLVRKNYAMMDPHDIVLDIVANFCAGKGFTTTHVQTAGFQIPSIKFNYMQPTKCLESLARLIGWEWYIDATKDIHFFLAETSPAPVTIDDSSGQIEWNSLDIDYNLQNMKNSVFVIGGTYTKSFTAVNTPDVYTTVADTVVYPIGYPYDQSTIAVTLDGVALTVGTDQQTDPSTVDVLYNDSSHPFVKLTSDPGDGHDLKIFGSAKIPIVAHASDPAAVVTYGEFQDVIVDSKISSVTEAQQRAQAEILQFGSPTYEVNFSTLVPGCRIGQNITLNSTKFGVSSEPLVIKRIEARVFVPGANSQLEYRIQAVGADTVTFLDIMTMLLQQQASQTTVDDSTVNENLVPLDEAIGVADSVTTSTGTRPYKWGVTSPQPRYGFAVWK